MDKLICKTSFTTSDEEALTKLGFKKTQWPNQPTILYNFYGEDVDGYGSKLEFILFPYV